MITKQYHASIPNMISITPFTFLYRVPWVIEL